MAKILNSSERRLPKTYEILKREYIKFQNRFWATRRRNNIQDQAEHYLLLLDLQEFIMNELGEQEEKLLELGIDKSKRKEVILFDYSKVIKYDQKLDIFHILDMKKRDFERYVKSNRGEK